MRIHELGHVVLYVSNVQRSADFYRDTLGFKEIHRDALTALFSSGRTHHELLLIEVGGVPQNIHRSPTPGLYHIGFKIGNSDDELRAAISELESNGIQIVGATDHHVTHSLYIMDPDNNELELYVDVDDSWKHDHGKLLSPARRLEL